MKQDLWIPRGYELPGGPKVRSLLYSGDDWQIYDAVGPGTILFARLNLVKRWSETNFIDDSLFGEVSIGNESFRTLINPDEYALTPVSQGSYSRSKVDMLSFSLALKESRKISKDLSFHDAIYVERYSRLLPTWTLTPRVDDEVILGTWVTGGVIISTNSFRRLSNLMGWMSAGDLVEIIEAAGLKVPSDANPLIQRSASPAKTREKDVSARTPTESDELHPEGHATDQKRFVLPGRVDLEEFFNEHVIDIIFNAEKYREMGIEFPSAIILCGPPGCGKTFAVERLVEFIDWPSYSINSSSIGSSYIHGTSQKISDLFDKAIDAAPSIIIIDEMESFLSNRQLGAGSGTHHMEEVAEFLRRIPEATKKKVLIIGMTNMIDMIDPAVLRRGRFDHIVNVDMPSRSEMASLLASLLSKLPREEDVRIESILDDLEGRALSDGAFVVREAARLAARVGKPRIDQGSLDAALNTLPGKKGKDTKRIGFS